MDITPEEKIKMIRLYYGDFIMQFEQCCSSIRMSLHTIFTYNGLTNRILLDILLHDAVASSLSNKLRACYYEIEKEQLYRNQVNKLLKYFQELYEIRNDFAHGNSHIINYSNNSEKQSNLTLTKPKINSKVGYDFNIKKFTIEILEQLNQNTLSIYLLFLELYDAIRNKRKLKDDFENELNMINFDFYYKQKTETPYFVPFY